MALPDMEYFLGQLVERQASDLYLTYGAPPALRIGDRILPLGESPLSDADIDHCIGAILSEHQRDEFASTLELNTAMVWNENARFRINVYRQQSHNAVVIRRIQM